MLFFRRRNAKLYLNTNSFEVLQNISGAFDDMMDNEKWKDANWFTNRLKFELFVICVLWKEEYTNLKTVLSELEQRDELYIPGASRDKKRYEIFNKEIKKKTKKNNII